MKNHKLFALICLLGICFASCKEESKTEWENYYGYTNDDIIGTYSFSNLSDAFDGVEGIGRHSCADAEITIRRYSSSAVEFSINCPNENFNRVLHGQPTLNNDDFMLHMASDYIPSGDNKYRAYVVTGYVLKNGSQQVRIHGYAAKNSYHIVQGEGGGQVYVQDNGEYYYFDVIKD